MARSALALLVSGLVAAVLGVLGVVAIADATTMTPTEAVKKVEGESGVPDSYGAR